VVLDECLTLSDHGLVLRLKSEYVVAQLLSRLAESSMDVIDHMDQALVKCGLSVAIGVEVSRSVLFAVDVTGSKSIEAMHIDQKLANNIRATAAYRRKNGNDREP